MKKVFLLVALVSMLSLSNSSQIAPEEKISEDNQVKEQNTAANNQTIVGLYPSNGQVVNVLKPAPLNYIRAMKEQSKGVENDYIIHDLNGDNVRIRDYCREGFADDFSKKIIFSFDTNNGEKEYVVKLSLKQDMSDPMTIVERDGNYYVENLLSGTDYYWQVVSTDGEETSPVYMFTTEEGFRMLSTGNVRNFRDMGGRPVKGGKRIKQGLIFRSGEMVRETYRVNGNGDTHYGNLDEQSLKIIQDDLNVDLQIDFRGDAEANHITQSDLRDENHPEIEYKRLPIGGYDGLLEDAYNFPRVKEMFLDFANAEQKHVVFNCWGGADRTGTIGFLLGGLLGMSWTDLVIDFELTSFSQNIRSHLEVEPTTGYYDFPGLVHGIKRSPYYEEGKEISEFIKDWMIGALGMTNEQVESLKTNLLEDY